MFLTHDGLYSDKLTLSWKYLKQKMNFLQLTCGDPLGFRFLFLFFMQYRGLNSGSHACWVGAVTVSHSTSPWGSPWDCRTDWVPAWLPASSHFSRGSDCLLLVQRKIKSQNLN
jgi:hypothetical protein